MAYLHANDISKQSEEIQMKTVSKVITLFVLLIMLASCSSFAPKPTETPIPTETSSPIPTDTPLPTPTDIPTETPVPPTETPDAPDLKMPSGEPDSEWEGIPVMPNAIAGEGDKKGYSFTIDASVDEIQAFYEKELAKLGWNMFANGEGDNGSLLLIFLKDTATLSLSIIPQPDGIMYVLIVK